MIRIEWMVSLPLEGDNICANIIGWIWLLLWVPLIKSEERASRTKGSVGVGNFACSAVLWEYYNDTYLCLHDDQGWPFKLVLILNKTLHLFKNNMCSFKMSGKYKTWMGQYIITVLHSMLVLFLVFEIKLTCLK